MLSALKVNRNHFLLPPPSLSLSPPSLPLSLSLPTLSSFSLAFSLSLSLASRVKALVPLQQQQQQGRKHSSKVAILMAEKDQVVMEMQETIQVRHQKRNKL